MNADGTIHAQKIRKSFGPKTVLKDVDLDIASGEICCIIGPSGSGKSTLLRCINGLETVDSGILKVNGEDFGYYETDTAYHALPPQKTRPTTHPRRHGLPVVQSLPQHDCPRERHGRTRPGQTRRQKTISQTST